MTETDNKTRYGRIAVILIALAIVIAALVSFIAMNNERIYEQNTKYLQGSTEQSARRISEWMTDSQTEIKLLSSMYESTLASVDEISAAGIEQLANYTKFDYTTISLSDGLTVDDKGQEADASDREYFARGMEGESGVCAVENSLFYNDLSVIFYTPLYFKDEVVGVICGAYREDSMEKFLRTYIFNEQTNTYLLDRNGDVMAHSSITYTSGVKNAVDLYLEDESSGNISRTELEASLESGVSVTFNYKGDSGAGTAYVMPIENYDWLIMRTFPSSITDGMQSRANAAGLMLVALVGGALALVAGFLLVQTMRQRRKLLSESAHVTSIVNSSLALFQRFAVIDLVANTYEYLKDEGCYEFTVSDTGCGMSEDFVKTVFEPFTRANDSRVTKVEGTGLGMSIVRSVVNLMNGTIDVKSKLGEGTTFTVTVYMKLRDGDDQDLTPLEGLRVLVADDEEAAAESACEVLKSIGMEPDYVLSGEDAVEAVRHSVEDERSYVAVILDWKMPGKSGIEAAREIREIVSDDMPIIILSAYDWTAVEQEARSVGVDAFIAKPLFKSRLVHVMKGLLTSEEESEPTSEYEVLKQSDFSGHRVLLTEDNSIAAAIALDIMGMTGLEVDHAENGRIAVEKLLDAEPGYYDLVFMDIQMPVMNGYESASAIRAAAEGKGLDDTTITRRPDLGEIPIVALTADAFADDVARARAAGMNAHMSKPMEIELLVKTLKEWL